MVRSKPNDPPVTRSEFQQETQAVRSDIKTLDDKVNRIAVELQNTQRDVRDIKETMFTKDEGQKIMGGIDKVMQRIEVFDSKALTQDHRLGNLEKSSEDHESRITSLESSAAK